VSVYLLPEVPMESSQACLLGVRQMRYWLFQILSLPSPNFWNFEPYQKRPKSCGKLLKGLKAKPKVNKIYGSWTKYAIIYHEVLGKFATSHILL
jgi:hypothetical protein